jgi:ribonuclease P protein component
VRVSGRHLLLFLLQRTAPNAASSPPRPRLGISVSKRVGGSVTRNRVRRRLREIFRRSRELFGEGAGDLVVNARPSASNATFDELAQEYRLLLTRGLGRATGKGESRRP